MRKILLAAVVMGFTAGVAAHAADDPNKTAGAGKGAAAGAVAGHELGSGHAAAGAATGAAVGHHQKKKAEENKPQ